MIPLLDLTECIRIQTSNHAEKTKLPQHFARFPGTSDISMDPAQPDHIYLMLFWVDLKYIYQ